MKGNWNNSGTDKMPKRTSDGADLPAGKIQANGNGHHKRVTEDDEMGEFEDRWEDELESEDEVVDAEEDGDDEGMQFFHTGFAELIVVCYF